MKAGRVFFAGIVGGAAMSAVMWLGRTTMGMDINLSMMLGTMVVQPPSATAWIVGFIMHLMISGLIALVYAWGFEYVTHRAGSLIGIGFSLIHSIVAGLFMGIVPAMHPLIPEKMPAPGFFLANKGAMYIVVLFILHAIYGAIVGGMYGTVEHASRDIVDERAVRA